MPLHAHKRENEMPDHSLSNRKDFAHANAVRAAVVAACVLGLAASITLHFEMGVPNDARLLDVGARTDRQGPDRTSGSSDFLRSPGGDPSVPQAASIFSSDAPGSAEIPIAQF
jgi:hypothetical protein